MKKFWKKLSRVEIFGICILLLLVLNIVFLCVTTWKLKQQGSELWELQAQSYRLQNRAEGADYWLGLDQKEFIRSYEIAYGFHGTEKDTLSALVTVKPKEELLDGTAALQLKGKVVPMEKVGGAFEVTLELPVAEEDAVLGMIFSGKTVEQTAKLYWPLSPREQFTFQFASTVTIGIDTIQLDQDQVARSGKITTTISALRSLGGRIEKLTLIPYLDGIPQTEQAKPILFNPHYHGDLTVKVPIRATIPRASTMQFIIEAVDSNGFLYRHWALERNNLPVAARSNIKTEVFNSKGVFLFTL